MYFLCADMCMKYIEGGINSEIVTSKIDTNIDGFCPLNCNNDQECKNCDCKAAASVCQRKTCTCLVLPPCCRKLVS
jgi:hypothetical protein